MDAAWPQIADAVMSPVLGPLTGELADAACRVDDPPTPSGSSYGSGWYGYVDKDLRTLLGQPVAGRSRPATAAPATSPPAAPRSGRRSTPPANELAAAQGADPAAWRADATAERIALPAGLLPRHDALDEPADLPAGHHRSATPLTAARYPSASRR